jgi:hypothetical protein
MAGAIKNTKTSHRKKGTTSLLPDKVLLIAPCGMNCGLCMAYLRERNKCPGCRVVDASKPKTRIYCKIKTCPQLKKNEFCFKCEDYPCSTLQRLDKRYRTRYNMSMIKNQEYIKKLGLEKFIRSEKRKWTCKECRGTICVHKGYCLNCGGPGEKN